MNRTVRWYPEIPTIIKIEWSTRCRVWSVRQQKSRPYIYLKSKPIPGILDEATRQYSRQAKRKKKKKTVILDQADQNSESNVKQVLEQDPEMILPCPCSQCFQFKHHEEGKSHHTSGPSPWPGRNFFISTFCLWVITRWPAFEPLKPRSLFSILIMQKITACCHLSSYLNNVFKTTGKATGAGEEVGEHYLFECAAVQDKLKRTDDAHCYHGEMHLHRERSRVLRYHQWMEVTGTGNHKESGQNIFVKRGA